MIALVNRIICAIFGHTDWVGQGGYTTRFNDCIHIQKCSRCGIIAHNVEPIWHRRAASKEDLPILPVDKHSLRSSDYQQQLKEFNNTHNIGTLAFVHNTTIEELEKIGYR